MYLFFLFVNQLTDIHANKNKDHFHFQMMEKYSFVDLIWFNAACVAHDCLCQYVIIMQGDQKVSVHLMITIPTQLMIWRWPSQNTFRMWTVLYWTRSSRTQCGVSINVWRMARGTLWTLLVTFFIVIIRCAETFWSPCIRTAHYIKLQTDVSIINKQKCSSFAGIQLFVCTKNFKDGITLNLNKLKFTYLIKNNHANEITNHTQKLDFTICILL